MTKKIFEPIRDYPAYPIAPVEYERALRHNLSNLSKQQLIDYAVGVAIEAERIEMEYQAYRTAVRAELSGLSTAAFLMGSGAYNPTAIVKLLEIEYRNPFFANILRNTESSTFKETIKPLTEGRKLGTKKTVMKAEKYTNHIKKNVEDMLRDNPLRKHGSIALSIISQAKRNGEPYPSKKTVMRHIEKIKAALK